ncbi:hypothetical protein I4U23_015941 [Adineta vaga]|nr:hypothetical protein I4U23_015941 [Adineta vaga]
MYCFTFILSALVTITLTNHSQAAEDTVLNQAKKFLAQVNVTISPNGTGYRWMSLCEVKAEANNNLGENPVTQTCTYTAHGTIKELRVKENGPNSRCSYNNEFYASGTMLSYENAIANQYEAAINLAAEAKYKAAATLIQSMKQQHVQNLRVAANKDSAKLTATAKNAPWFGGGANCDLTLEGFVNQFF